MHFPAVVVGAGPAGLACARTLSAGGIRTLVIEKKPVIGPKVCAGGLTWGGLAGRIPDQLIERAFPIQHISTRFQKITVQASHPIIVTVDRKRLGEHMLEQAKTAGVEILSSTRVTAINRNSLVFKCRNDDHLQQVSFDHLIGADGSTSLVRRYLNLPVSRMGVGINYQIPGQHATMEWHLNSDYFKNGYGWIFPHRDSFSLGAYVDAATMEAHKLKENLIQWATTLDLDLAEEKCRAEIINTDYRGWDFGRFFLVGDAAGLASSLTGEGIYPAIVSGEIIARKILDPDYNCSTLDRLIKKHRHHGWLVRLTAKRDLLTILLFEILVLALRSRLLHFSRLEMGD